jgi:Response regulator of the LytR/AlgR family
MFKIAVCDDNIADLSNLISMLNDYKALRRDRYIIEATAFNSALDLIAAMESGQRYELVILDILMPFLSGMEAANEIRQFNNDIKIIFLTSSPEFAVESYSVRAYYYALKPIWKEKLTILLDKVIRETEAEVETSLLIKSKSGLTRVYFNRIEFAEVIGRNIHFHLTDGTVIETVGAMLKLEKELLSNPSFIKPHRSYIINMSHIETLGQREIKMQSHSSVPIAKANFGAVKSAYISFSFKDFANSEEA